jgi:hypothetical protein
MPAKARVPHCKPSFKTPTLKSRSYLNVRVHEKDTDTMGAVYVILWRAAHSVYEGPDIPSMVLLSSCFVKWCAMCIVGESLLVF